MPIMDTLKFDAIQLRRLTTRRGWLRKDLAENSGVSRGRISAAFNGKPVSPPNAKKIADALGVTIEDLIAEPEAASA